MTVLNINEKCILLKNKCLERLNETKAKQNERNEKYTKLHELKRKKGSTPEIEEAIHKLIEEAAKLSYDAFRDNDTIQLIDFLTSESDCDKYRGISLKEGETV